MPHKFKNSKRYLIGVFKFLLVFAEKCTQIYFFCYSNQMRALKACCFVNRHVVFIVTSSSDRLCKPCMNSAGRGGLVRLFRPNHACSAFSQFKLLGSYLLLCWRGENSVFYTCELRRIIFCYYMRCDV